MIKKGNMCFKCNCIKNWYGDDCSQMVKPGDDVNEKCNMANTDCGTGGKVDEKSCKCICGKCRTGKFCTEVKKTAECAEFKEKNFADLNKKVLNKWGNDDLADPVLKQKIKSLDEEESKEPPSTLQIPAKHKADIVGKLDSLVAEGKAFKENAMVDQDEKKVKADFESIQSGAMIEVASKKTCEKGCDEHGICQANGVCACFPGYTGKACSKKVACPSGCSGRGICKYGLCFCNPGYTGKDCTKVDISFKAPETSHAVGAAAKTASPMHEAKANDSRNTWKASGVVVVGFAMFAVGVAAGLFSKFMNDKRKRSEASKILEETSHDDNMRSVLYSSLASPPLPTPPTVGL
jgi:hypothetical protein